MNGVLDNDFILKGLCFGLLPELVAVIPARVSNVGILSAARFVVRGAIRRTKRIRLRSDPVAIEERLASFTKQAQELDPTPSELRLAAALEYAAQHAFLALDAGESQLCAIVVSRGLGFLATGDKRAIAAVGGLLSVVEDLGPAEGKLVCLEQVIKRLVEATSVDTVRPAICGEPGIDKALSNCFSCSSPTAPPGDSCCQGLDSYIGNLRKQAPRVLSPG